MPPAHEVTYAIPTIFGYLLIPLCVAVVAAVGLTYFTSARRMQKLLDDKADKERLAKFTRKKAQSIADAIATDDIDALEDLANANSSAPHPRASNANRAQNARAVRPRAPVQQELPLNKPVQGRSDEELFADIDLPMPTQST